MFTRIASGFVLFITSLTLQAQSLPGYDVDPTTGYRMEHYRAPVPRDLPGGITINTATALSMAEAGTAVFIDVYPPKGLGPDPIDGHWLSNEKHRSIPGATWLPEVGRGHLEADALDYFQRHLKRLSHDDTSTPLVFFCTSDCWQSWNASRRAMSLGYDSVYWYPLGTDGWLENDLPLQPVSPVNFLDNGTEALPMFPEQATVYLIDQNATERAIGTVTFTQGSSDTYAVNVSLDEAPFTDQFLSMRPFQCITSEKEWFCHLPYPYPLRDTVSADNLTDLEYQLLFIHKSPREFGIDPWNGVYYRLHSDGQGGFDGTLLQGDLNVLASPPPAYSYPIDPEAFIEDGADNRLFPTLKIRP